jgi:hypothetical protein
MRFIIRGGVQGLEWGKSASLKNINSKGFSAGPALMKRRGEFDVEREIGFHSEIV